MVRGGKREASTHGLQATDGSPGAGCGRLMSCDGDWRIPALSSCRAHRIRKLVSRRVAKQVVLYEFLWRQAQNMQAARSIRERKWADAHSQAPAAPSSP